MANYTTGIFYHPSFSRRSYLTVGARLADFPVALDEILKGDNVLLCKPKPVARRLLLKVHTPDLLERVEKEPLCSTAWHSAGGVVSAGLSGPCYWNIADLMTGLAKNVCGGKLEIVLGGGSNRRLATYLIPPIIKRLARQDL